MLAARFLPTRPLTTARRRPPPRRANTALGLSTRAEMGPVERLRRFTKTWLAFKPNPVAAALGLAVPAFGRDPIVSRPVVHTRTDANGVTVDTIFDFDKLDAATVTRMWHPLDDVVMGGSSSSEVGLISTDDGEGGGHQALRFTGNVEPRGGGFVSVRTKNLEPPLDLSAARGLRLRVRGDGQRYKIVLRTVEDWFGPSYAHAFDTTAEAWHDVELPFDDFVATERGNLRATGKRLDADTLKRVYSVQLMLSKYEPGGGQTSKNPRFTAGFFELCVHRIAATRPPTVSAQAGDVGATSSSLAHEPE